MGLGVVEMEIIFRKSEFVVIFYMDKIEFGVFNFLIFRMFVDLFNIVGFIIDLKMYMGFCFEVWDIFEYKRVIFNILEEFYDFLVFIGVKSCYVIKRVYLKFGYLIFENELVVVVSIEKLYEVVGEYVGKDDLVVIVRV